MKSILIIVLSLAFLQTMLAQPSSTEDSAEQPVEEELPVLLIFSGSDWCKPCIKLKKEVIDTPVFQDYAKSKLQIQVVDFPYKKGNKLSKERQAENNALAEQYNPEGLLPNMVLVQSDGELIAPVRARSSMSLLKELDVMLNRR